MGINVVADRELARRNHTFGLVADVEEYFVRVDLHDATVHDVTLVERDDRGVNCIGERLSTEVVEYDFRLGLVQCGGRRATAG